MAQVTKWDWMYLYGRMAADTAHRFTVYGIIFATGCLGVLAVFSVGDMIVYNRRKRAIYFEDLEKEQAKILASAREAVQRGVASPAQTALVEGIAEEETLMAKKIAERKAGSKILWWLHGDWKEEKELKEQRRLAVEDFKQKESESGQGLGIAQAVQEARVNATSKPVVGGPLDQVAANAAVSAEKTSKGWFGWISGGSKKE